MEEEGIRTAESEIVGSERVMGRRQHQIREGTDVFCSCCVLAFHGVIVDVFSRCVK